MRTTYREMPHISSNFSKLKRINNFSIYIKIYLLNICVRKKDSKLVLSLYLSTITSLIIAIIDRFARHLQKEKIDFYRFFEIYLRAKRSSGAPRRALSSVGKCKSNPLLRRTGCKRKGYDLIVYDKWTKRGD